MGHPGSVLELRSALGSVAGEEQVLRTVRGVVGDSDGCGARAGRRRRERHGQSAALVLAQG